MPTITISDKQHSLLKAVLAATKAQTDWKEVAKKTDKKTAKYARDEWAKVRDKLVEGHAADGPVKGKKRKASMADSNAATAKMAKVDKAEVLERAESQEDTEEELASESVKAKDGDQSGDIL